ncbi:Zinc finger domain containing protein [Aphelenchoides bicaudatus]|nr:Zinc finger domain containing protein [Aphelenchoides bicaudatus]
MQQSLIDSLDADTQMSTEESRSDSGVETPDFESTEKTDKEVDFEERNQLNIDSNPIETTLFLQNHEKISLISSLGPLDSINEAASTSSNCSDRQCRICLLCHETKRKRLISPCRCSGSIKYAHTSCLVRWIDTSSAKRVCPARCEICNYSYKRRSILNKLQFDSFHVQLPSVSLRDKVLNVLFVLLVIIMTFCAWVSIHYLSLSIRRSNAFRVSNTLVGQDDVTMFAATLLFFVAFFLAIFTQYRAETSVIYILVRCWSTNRNWQISEYDWRQDVERQQKLAPDNQLVSKSSYHNC